MKQAHQTEAAGEHGHLLHGEEVLVDGLVGVREDGCDLVLCGRYFVVLRAHGDAEFPQLIVESLQEVVHGRADGAEVVFFELLALAGRMTEQRAPSKHQVFAALVFFLRDEEEFLLGADRGGHAVRVFVEDGQHALGLLFDRAHGTQQRRFLVECFAGV